MSGPLFPLATRKLICTLRESIWSFPCLLLAPRDSFPKDPGPPSCQASAGAFSAGNILCSPESIPVLPPQQVLDKDKRPTTMNPPIYKERCLRLHPL